MTFDFHKLTDMQADIYIEELNAKRVEDANFFDSALSFMENLKEQGFQVFKLV